MIDPTKVTNYERTQYELEEFLLFAIVVAGKGAFQQAKKLEQFLTKYDGFGATPFEIIRTMDADGTLDFHLRDVKMGQYNRIGSAFRGVATFFALNSNVTLSIRLLECIKGVGMKTARFFMLHTQENAMYACLDTHILKWLGEQGHEVPKTTPQGEKYLALEKIFLEYARNRSMSPATLDLQIWNSRHCESSKTN